MSRSQSVLSPDQAFMRRALSLAARAWGHTSPNPLVGAVLVKSGRVIAEGYHRRAGLPHAEVEALRRAGHRARGATLYVTLEPCAHQGRTGPCCEAIIAAGIRRVVAAARDPNPLVNGKGLRRLRRAGIHVTCGVLAKEARALNAPFWKVMQQGLPWVIAKVGQSLDGKIATRLGESRWITSQASRHEAHRHRARVDAILVGANTIRKDNPLLTVRGRWPHREGLPIKVIVSGKRLIPVDARCLSCESPAPTIIALPGSTASRRFSALAGVEVISVPTRQSRVPLRSLLRLLAKRGIQSILIEGGGEILASAFSEKLVDHVLWFVAPLIVGGHQAPSSVQGVGVAHLPQAARLTRSRIRLIGPDLLVEADVRYPTQGRKTSG